MLSCFTILKTYFIIIPSYFTILPHPKILFLLKYYFLIFLYYFFITVIFVRTHFLGFPTIFFFPLLLPQPLATHKPSTTTATAPKTQATDQPINNHSHDTKNSSHRSTHQQSQPWHQKPISPCRRFETHQSKPIQKKSSLEPPSDLQMINPTDPPTDQQIHRFKCTDQPIQTHHQSIPAHRSKPSLSIHANPTSKIQNPVSVRDRERK